MSNELAVYVGAATIAKEMVVDRDFAYEIFKELAWYVYESKNGDKFFDNMFREIFVNEDSDVLFLFEDMLKQFEHLKEENT